MTKLMDMGATPKEIADMAITPIQSPTACSPAEAAAYVAEYEANHPEVSIDDIAGALVPALAPEGQPVEIQQAEILSVPGAGQAYKGPIPAFEIPEGGLPADQIAVAMATGEPKSALDGVKIIVGERSRHDQMSDAMMKGLKESGADVQVIGQTESKFVPSVADLQLQVQAMEKMLRQNGISKKRLFKQFGTALPKVRTQADIDAIDAAKARREKRAAKRVGQKL